MVGVIIALGIILGLYHVIADFIDYLIYKSANLVDKGIDAVGDIANKGRTAVNQAIASGLERTDNTIVKGISKVNDTVGKGMDKVNTETFKMGVVPSLRVILNGIRLFFAEIIMLIVLLLYAGFCGYDSDEAWDDVWGTIGLPFTLVLIGYVIFKKLTLGKYVQKKARTYIDLQLSKNAEISAKEFMNLPPIWRCQKWNFKIKGQVTFYYVRDTFHATFNAYLQKKITDTVKDDRIYMYTEYMPFATQMKQYGEQVDRFLPDSYTVINNLGFFSNQIRQLIMEKVHDAVQIMPNLFSQPDIYKNVISVDALNGLYSKAISISQNEKIGMYAPFVTGEIKSQKDAFLLSQVMQAKENAPILYKKNPPGLIDNNGIYKTEPSFEGQGCVDCGVLTMPDDDEEE